MQASHAHDNSADATIFRKRFGNHHYETPYAAALGAHAGRDTVALMVPGHGSTGEGSAHKLAAFFGERALELDIPGLIDGIDIGENNPLEQAHHLAAEAWGARRAWFLTNGASQANRMAAYAIRSLGIGDTVVAQRSAHSSFTDGVILADLTPHFMFPSIDERNGVNHGISPEVLERGLADAQAAGRNVGAVYVISPSYFGAVADVAALSKIAHRHGVPLVVDGAWGSHFGFHPDLPDSPARLGADLTVSSTHKLAGSFTQSAMLHLGEGPFSDQLETLIERAHTLTQTTSPSALLLGSLDIARSEMATGYEVIADAIAWVDRARGILRDDGRYRILSDGFTEFDDIVDHDPMRISLEVSCTGMTGHAVRSTLLKRYGIVVEISTVTAIVAFVGAGKRPDLDRLIRALFELADAGSAAGAGEPITNTLPTLPPLPAPGELALRPRDAYFAANETVSAADAIGRVSADALAAYPPGIPNVIPGEVITAETVTFLRAVAASPAGYVRGSLNKAVSSFRVVKR
jgi:arginine/lysine/ornithine decarboxylase